jgi:aspartyl-tRNA(Asn)/glutamyl-tRNA(Gln) amidotransferase subunit A
VAPEVRRIAGEAARVFETDLGCTVEEASPGWDDPAEAFFGVMALETDLKGMRQLVDRYADNMSPHLVDFIRRPWTAEDLTNANVQRKAVVNRMWRFMRRYDLLLTPTLTCPPFAVHMQGPEKIEGRIVSPFQWLAFTYPINMTGQPATSVPAGWTEDGLPIGLQIVGRHLDDPSVLRASAAFEAARPWQDRQPPLLAELGL